LLPSDDPSLWLAWPQWLRGSRFRRPLFAQTRSLDAALEPVRAKHALPALAAAVVKDGVIVAAGAVGVRVHGTDIKVTIDDRFHLAPCW